MNNVRNSKDCFSFAFNISLLFRLAQNKDAGESDSEKEQEEMNELENLLKKHDPSFAK